MFGWSFKEDMSDARLAKTVGAAKEAAKKENPQAEFMYIGERVMCLTVEVDFSPKARVPLDAKDDFFMQFNELMENWSKKYNIPQALAAYPRVDVVRLDEEDFFTPFYKYIEELTK